MYPYLKLSGVTYFIYHIDTFCHGLKGLCSSLKKKKKKANKTCRSATVSLECNRDKLSKTFYSLSDLEECLWWRSKSRTNHPYIHTYTNSWNMKSETTIDVEWNKRWALAAAFLQSFSSRQLWEFFSVIWIWNCFVLQVDGQWKSWVMSHCDVFSAAHFFPNTEICTTSSFHQKGKLCII